MSRAVLLLAFVPLFTPGCIIYEERYHGGKCQQDECPSTTDLTLTPTTPVTGPQLTDAVELTVDQAYPGQQLLTEMIPAGSGAIDLTSVTGVTFERDVEVVDLIVHPTDIVLLLQIADEAEPGDVTVQASTLLGDEYVLAVPFHILPGGTTTSGGSGATPSGGSGATTATETSGTSSIGTTTSDTGGV